jgi:hypothetical protein
MAQQVGPADLQALDHLDRQIAFKEADGTRLRSCSQTTGSVSRTSRPGKSALAELTRDYSTIRTC